MCIRDSAEREQVWCPTLFGTFEPPATGRSDPEPGHHLVEHEQGAVGAAYLRQSRVETDWRDDDPHVGGDLSLIHI